MEVVLISDDVFVEHEVELISSMFQKGLRRFHLRKPNASSAEMSTLLQKIPAELHPKMVVHGHDALMEQFDLSHVHSPTGQSRSCHALDELDALASGIAYVFLSPIFNSISKQGYLAAFREEALQTSLRKARSTKVFALGGVDVDKIETCERLGFDGIALLGAVWRKQDPVKALTPFLQWQN